MSPRKPLTWSDWVVSQDVTLLLFVSSSCQFRRRSARRRNALPPMPEYPHTQPPTGEKLLVMLPSAKPEVGIGCYAIIGSIADRGTSTCKAPAEAGNNTPWSKKKITPSLTTAKF